MYWFEHLTEATSSCSENRNISWPFNVSSVNHNFCLLNHVITEELRLEGTSRDHLIHLAQLQQVAQDPLQSGFQSLSTSGSSTASGQPVLEFDNHHRKSLVSFFWWLLVCCLFFLCSCKISCTWTCARCHLCSQWVASESPAPCSLPSPSGTSLPSLLQCKVREVRSAEGTGITRGSETNMFEQVWEAAVMRSLSTILSCLVLSHLKLVTINNWSGVSGTLAFPGCRWTGMWVYEGRDPVLLTPSYRIARNKQPF